MRDVVPDCWNLSFQLTLWKFCSILPVSDNPLFVYRSGTMTAIIRVLIAFAVCLVRPRLSLHLEILALQHPLSVLQRSIRRACLDFRIPLGEDHPWRILRAWRMHYKYEYGLEKLAA